MAYGICYTWSSNVKKYEQGLFSFSPNRIKFVDIDNHSAEPFIPWIFTPDNHPPGVSLEEGTARYEVGVRDPDITLENYLTYTPPDGYELVSEDHKNDTGVEEYYVSKYFYCEPFTVYYGTAGKTFSDLGLSASKYFYYKKKDKPVKPDTFIDYYVTFTLNSGMLNCKCNSVTNIPGTNNGNVTLGIDIQLSDGIGSTNNEHIYFSWVMKDGINESKSCSMPYYAGSGFTTQSAWEDDNGDGTKTHYTFHVNHDSIPSRPNTKSL